MNKKAVVLLSGGIDSTTCLAMAVQKYGVDQVIGLSLYYGQKHAKEMQCAEAVAKYYGCDRIERQVMGVYDFSDCSLLQGNGEIKKESYAEQLAEMGGEGTVETYVPFRNGLFLAYASAVAISLGAEAVYYGAHADDAAGRAYPDCTPEFDNSMRAAIYEGSGRTLHLKAPLLNLTKAQVVAKGLELKAPYHLTWSCYEGGDTPCGKCGTCIDRAAAFAANGVEDPALSGAEDLQPCATDFDSSTEVEGQTNIFEEGK
jgi:7-cyano-7-deazaguanine synthase